MLHDTTEFTYQREDMSAVGLISKGSVRKDAQGRPHHLRDQPALQFGSNSGRSAAGFDCRQILEPQSIQRPEGEKKGSSRSDRGKEKSSLAGELARLD
jgi:hypothetical protein